MIDSDCDSCGAMLPHPDLDGNVTCLSCGRATRVSVDAPAAPPTARPAPVVVTSTTDGTVASTTKPMKAGCVVVGLLLAVCGVVAAAAGVFAVSQVGDELGGSNPTSEAGSDLLVLGGTAHLVPDADGQDRVLVTVQDISAGPTERSLALVALTESDAELVWQSEPIDPSASVTSVAADDQTLYVGIEDEVRALDPNSGETRWSATLRDTVTGGCAQCFAVVDGRLIVRTADAYVTGYGADSDEPLWSRRLRATSGSISPLGDRLIVIDEPEDPSQLNAAELVDPSTGETLSRSTPTCAAGDGLPWDLELSPRDVVRAIDGSDDVIAAFGFGDGCVARWDPSAGQVRFASRLPDAGSINQAEVLAGPRQLVVATTSGTLSAVDITTGSVVSLAVPMDVRARPIAVEGDLLVAESDPTRGNASSGLVAFDVGSGEVRWAEPLPNGATYVSRNPGWFSSDALFDETPRAVLAPSAESLNVLTFDGSDRTVRSEALALGTGDVETADARGFASRSVAGTPSLSVVGVVDGHLVVTLDSLVQWIPIESDGAIATFPEAS